jgi:hypothetical protein
VVFVGAASRTFFDADYSCGGSTGLFTGFPFHPGHDGRDTCTRLDPDQLIKVAKKYSSGSLALLTAGGITGWREPRLKIGMVEVID